MQKVLLPSVAGATVSASTALPGLKATGAPLTVLLVEDHEINRKLAEIMLQRMGYRCTLASDGQQALERLAQERCDVVLMDVMMPVMDGPSALRQLRALEAGGQTRTPVLMVTAHAMTGDNERFIAAGADGYVSKPMSQLTLSKEIEATLVKLGGRVLRRGFSVGG